MTKTGLIITNVYSRSSSELNQSLRLKDEFATLGVKIDVCRNGFFPCGIFNSALQSDAETYDFCVYLDKDKYVSEMLEKSGLRLFNSHNGVRVCDDKMRTYISLAGHGVPVVDTLPGLLCYSPDEPVRAEIVDSVERKLGYPIIIKQCYGSLGKGVYMAKDRTRLVEIMEKVKCSQHLFQKAIMTSLGRDIRVIVIGGKVCAAMKRNGENDFRSNLGYGGKGSRIELTSDFIEIAEKSASVLKLDYCGVDILIGERGLPLVCEVNSNAFFGGIEDVTGINIGREYAKYIYNEMYCK